MSLVIDTVRQFIVDDLGYEGDAAELTADRPLIEEHVLDSIGILSLAAFLEAEYGIEVEDHEIVSANLGSLARIDRYVDGKRG